MASALSASIFLEGRCGDLPVSEHRTGVLTASWRHPSRQDPDEGVLLSSALNSFPLVARRLLSAGNFRGNLLAKTATALGEDYHRWDNALGRISVSRATGEITLAVFFSGSLEGRLGRSRPSHLLISSFSPGSSLMR